MRLKELREEAQLTQKQLAEKIDNVQRNVSNWENGTSEPDCETIVKLADVLGVTTDELLGRGAPPAADIAKLSASAPLLREILQLSDKQREALLNFLKTLNP